MCEYCENSKILGKSDSLNDGVEAVIDGGILRVSGWFDGCVGIKPVRIEIDVCPKCGRDLRGAANERG
mgnify:CR=1 FL=1